MLFACINGRERISVSPLLQNYAPSLNFFNLSFRPNLRSVSTLQVYSALLFRALSVLLRFVYVLFNMQNLSTCSRVHFVSFRFQLLQDRLFLSDWCLSCSNRIVYFVLYTNRRFSFILNRTVRVLHNCRGLLLDDSWMPFHVYVLGFPTDTDFAWTYTEGELPRIQNLLLHLLFLWQLHFSSFLGHVF